MARTYKHKNACMRAQCGICHPWKKVKHQLSRAARLRPSERRKLGLPRSGY